VCGGDARRILRDQQQGGRPHLSRIGTCSWADDGLIKRWYPRGVSSAAARLVYYAERFDTVEVNNTFYRLPSPSAVEGWVEQSPPGFVFAVKASRYLTHVKRLQTLDPYLERFFQPLDALASSPRNEPINPVVQVRQVAQTFKIEGRILRNNGVHVP
jgi:uncharacterized protein YecE (DUF72 family)